MKRRRQFTTVWMLAIAALLSREAAADDTALQCDQHYSHVLGGHAFLPTFIVPTPFANSSALVSLGFAYGDIGNLSLGAFSPRAEGQVLIFKGFAISFGLGGRMVAGLDGDSAISFGASAGYSYKLGALYELVRSDLDVLSVAAEVEHPNSFSVSPIEGAKSFITGLLTNATADFVSNTVVNQWRANARWAHSFSKPFGIQALAGFRYNQRKTEFRDSTDATRLQLGAQFETDFKPMIGIPVGITLSYLRGQLIDTNIDFLSSVNTVSVGLYLTSSPSFNVGIEYGGVHTGNQTSRAGGVVARMYFN